jgi:hypothetical protein
LTLLRYQRKAYDGEGKQKKKFLGLAVDGRVRMVRSLARRRQKCMGTMGRQRSTYQRRAYDGKAAKGAVDGHRRGWAAKKGKKKKNSTHFPSMAVCYGTAVGPKKGKSTWGVSFLTGDPDISLWPSTEGPSQKRPSRYHRWLCADIWQKCMGCGNLTI